MEMAVLDWYVLIRSNLLHLVRLLRTFIIEGCITVFFGLVTFFILPDFPYAFKQSWLGGDEVRYITLRAKYHTGRNPPDLKFKWSDVRASLKDWKTYTIMMMFWWGG